MFTTTTTWMGIDAGYSLPGFGFSEIVCGEDGIYKPGQFIHAEAYSIPEKDSTKKNRARYNAFKSLSQTSKDCIVVSSTVNRIKELIETYNPTKVIVELPTGGAKSSSAVRAMGMSTSMCVAALTVLSQVSKVNFSVVYITPNQNKKGSTGVAKWGKEDKVHVKWDVLQSVNEVWPDIQWPHKKSKRLAHEVEESTSWAMSDAMSCILTAVRKENDVKAKLKK